MKRGAKLFKRKKKKKDRKAGGEDDGGDSGSSYGDYTEDDASNADDLDTATATDGESSDTEEPVAWRPQLVDSDSEEGEESSAPNGRERGRFVPTKAASQKAASPRRDEEEDEDGKISQPVTDPLGLLGTLSLPPALDKTSHVDPSRDGFDARKYLGDLHTQTSYADLQQGARTLRSLLRGQEMQLKTFVRDNFGRFISCKDSIDGIYEEIKDNDMSHHAIQKLNDTYIDLQLRSDRLFGSLLERRAEIEEKRNVLAALKRYQTIFNLPLTIQRHLDQHEYEKAVREYKKAVGYLAGTNVRIFVKVSDQINSLADRLRDQLLASLRDPALTLAEHDYHIGLLHDLGGDVDPAWHYLSNVQASIVTALTTTDPPADESADAVSGGGDGATTAAPGGARLPAIRRLCNVLLTGLPSLTHMAHIRPPAPPRGEEGTRKLVEECLALYAQQVRAAFAAPDAGEAMATAGGVDGGAELLDDVRQCILEVAACAQGLAPALAGVDLDPSTLLAPLISELSLLFTSSIRRHTLARVAKLWEDGAEQGGAANGDSSDDADADAEVGKGWGADVYMAKRLATLLRSALHHYQSLPAIEERVLEEIESLALETVKAFADGLHAACWPGNDDDIRSIASAPRYGADLGPEERMIVAMANSAYAREEVVILIERLISTLRPAAAATTAATSKPSTSSTTVVDHLSTLENLLAAEYVRCKAAQIYALLGPALADQLATPFSAPPEVREYVIEVVAGVVTAQAELAPVALLVRTRIITSLLERITSCYEESLRSRLPPPTRSRPWDGGCALQLHTDVFFLQAAFAQRLSPTASAGLTRLQKSFLPRLTSTQEEEARAAVGKGMANAALILRALQ